MSTKTTIERRYTTALELLERARTIAADLADKNMDDPAHRYIADLIDDASDKIENYLGIDE